MHTSNEQIALAAQNLLAELDRLVPDSTVHWAVEEARKAATMLVREAATIRCRPTRHAVIRGLGHDKLATIRRYLPSNYTADSDGGDIYLHGVDSAGWSLDGYVIPRLASGLYRAEEI